MWIFVALLIALSTASNAFVCEGDGFFPDPTDCAKFYRCVTGTKYSFDCGPGTHFNPNCDCCDWPHNANCEASGGAQPSRYQQPGAHSGQSYGQQPANSFRQYGQQPSAQSGQDLNQQYWQQSGQQSGHGLTQYGGQQSSVRTGQDPGQTGEYWQQSGQYGQQSPNSFPGHQSGHQSVGQSSDYWQTHGRRPTAQSGQYGQQPNYHQYGDYGQPGGRRQQVGSQRLPDESQQIYSREPVDESDDRSPNQRPNRVYDRRPQKQYPKTDRRGELPVESGVVYEDEDNQRNVRPKPRPQPKSNRRDENVLTEEDEEFDHKFDEPIEERRPKPRPRPRPQPQSRRKQPQTEAPEEDEDYEEVTTSRPKVPKRKHRVRITTPSPSPTTTEAEDSVEEDKYNEFSQFENDVKDDEESLDEDTKKWLHFENQEPTTTTTEDPYVSMLKERVPPQPRNKTRIDRNRNYGRRFGTTPQPVRPTDQVTTVDTFDKEWTDFIAGKNDQNRDQRPDQSSKTNNKKQKKKPSKATDPMLMSDVISYFNCTEAGKSCDVCEELDWIKYSGTGLKTTPFRSYKFLPIIASKQCYKACSESKQCIAFAYSLTTGICHIYDQMTTEDIQANKEFNTVIKNPKNNVMNEEWVHTKNGQLSGRELYSVKADNVFDCLQECVNDMEYCMAVNFDQVEEKCRVFDAYEGYAVNTMKANSVSLQHLSVFEDNNQWRFEEIGHKTLANSRPIESKEVKDSDECFYECIENVANNCSFVTIEDKQSDEDEEEVTKLCHIFPFSSTPKWIKSKKKLNTSYAISVPKNHSRVQTFPGYTYVGNPVEIKEGLTEDECREYAEQNCPFCRKYTSVVETKECALFSDSALLSPALKDLNYTEKSGLLSLPKDNEYMAFKRIPWKMFNTNVSPHELKGEINGQKCLQFCLQQKLCVATALVYNTVDSSMFCYFFKESDLKNANMTEYENVDLFVKIMDRNDIPGHISNQTDDCSDGEPLDSAIKNVNDLSANLDDISPKKSSGDSSRYNSNSYPLSPHGYDYYGGPNEEDSESEQTSPRKVKSRPARSVNRNIETEDNELEEEVRGRKKRKEEVDESEKPLAFIENIKQNARKKAVLDRIPTLTSEIRKKVKQNKLESLKAAEEEGVQQKKKTSRQGRVDSLTEDCDNENEFGFDSNRCKTKTEVKDVSKMCTQIPKIIYSDQELMQSCNETQVGKDCPVICRAGYEPTQEKIKCRASGDRNYWKHSKHVKCKPIESECETGSLGTDIRVKAITKYPEEKVHFITKFDKNRKLPQFSVYVHTKENSINNTVGSSEEEVQYVTNSCEELEDKQMTISEYKESNYLPKPLLPKNAFIYSNGAQSLLNTMSNIAPQDVFTSRGPWLTLENRTLEMLRNRPGIVISGVCPQSLIESQGRHNRHQKKSDKTLDIPQCFWSIYCVPFGEGVTAAAFFGENTHPIAQLEKQSRVEQIKAIRDQRFIVKLLGTDMYKQLWIETYNAYKNLNKGIKSFIYQCAESDKITSEGMEFWQGVITGDENTEEWQTKFTYGLEKNDLQTKKSSRSEPQTRQQKRRERDDQNISDESMS